MKCLKDKKKTLSLSNEANGHMWDVRKYVHATWLRCKHHKRGSHALSGNSGPMWRRRQPELIPARCVPSPCACPSEWWMAAINCHFENSCLRFYTHTYICLFHSHSVLTISTQLCMHVINRTLNIVVTIGEWGWGHVILLSITYHTMEEGWRTRK